MTADAIDKAITQLMVRRTFPFGEHNLVVACLIRERDWRPLEAPWWRKKEACIIGADLEGIFFSGTAMEASGIGITGHRPTV